MTNLYKVWSGDAGYLMVHADSRLEAIKAYAGDIGMNPNDVFESGADMHCRLIYNGIEAAYPDSEDNEIACVKLLDLDLIFAGITSPQWAEHYMFYGWWWGDTDDKH